MVEAMTTDYLQSISLQSVHLHSCHHQRGPGVIDSDPVVDTRGTLQPVGGLDAGELAYVVTLKYAFQNSETDEEIASGEVAYVASYRVADEISLSEDQVHQFGNQGALFQVHPFLREHLATMCQRSGLVAYPLPILIHDPAEGPAPTAD